MKSVIINSIGKANPSVGGVLSKVLSIPAEVVLKLIYCAPTVLFHNVDEVLATNAYNLLSHLGIEAELVDSASYTPEPSTELVDVAVYINDPISLFNVNKKLAEFIGCSEKESLNLLMNDPSIVLGNVSATTASVLAQRLGTEVMYASPQQAFYTLKINGADEVLQNRLVAFAQKMALLQSIENNLLKDLTYNTAQEFWKQFGTSGKIELINQSLQRYEILLENFDLENAQQVAVLNNEVGMPISILQEVFDNLPVVLHESVSWFRLSELMKKYKTLGIACTHQRIDAKKANIKLNAVKDLKTTKDILSNFYNESEIASINTSWESPKPMQLLLSRYLAALLEEQGCEVECAYVL